MKNKRRLYDDKIRKLKVQLFFTLDIIRLIFYQKKFLKINSRAIELLIKTKIVLKEIILIKNEDVR